MYTYLHIYWMFDFILLRIFFATLRNLGHDEQTGTMVCIRGALSRTGQTQVFSSGEITGREMGGAADEAGLGCLSTWWGSPEDLPPPVAALRVPKGGVSVEGTTVHGGTRHIPDAPQLQRRCSGDPTLALALALALLVQGRLVSLTGQEKGLSRCGSL